jgi:hypothetical protein
MHNQHEGVAQPLSGEGSAAAPAPQSGGSPVEAVVKPQLRTEPLYIVRRTRGLGFSYSLEFGDHRCHSERGREPSTTKRRLMPDGWVGTLDEATKVFEADEARELAAAAAKAPAGQVQP